MDTDTRNSGDPQGASAPTGGPAPETGMTDWSTHAEGFFARWHRRKSAWRSVGGDEPADDFTRFIPIGDGVSVDLRGQVALELEQRLAAEWARLKHRVANDDDWSPSRGTL